MSGGLKAITVCGLCATALLVGGAKAQQPTPPLIVVQPASQPTAAPAPAAPSGSEQALAAALKALEQVKSDNDATLKKQEEMMQRLEELLKEAEQLKIFSKRV